MSADPRKILDRLASGRKLVADSRHYFRLEGGHVETPVHSHVLQTTNEQFTSCCYARGHVSAQPTMSPPSRTKPSQQCMHVDCDIVTEGLCTIVLLCELLDNGLCLQCHLQQQTESESAAHSSPQLALPIWHAHAAGE